MRKFSLVFFVIFFGRFVALGQLQNVSLPAIAPPSPNAAAIEKFIETPVSLYTGVPSISIPFYEINEGRIKVPVTLDYHAGGIRVEETSSNVGLGWSLNAGGMISRTIRGRPDDDPHPDGGYFNYGDSMTVARLLGWSSYSLSDDSLRYYSTRANRGVARELDMEPDEFQLSAPGLSFKFYYNQEKKCFFNDPASKVKINYFGYPLSSSYWDVVNTDGIVYHFEAMETTNMVWDAVIDAPVITAWMLTSISDPTTGRGISFIYTPPVTMNYINGLSEIHYYPLLIDGPGSASPQLLLQEGEKKQVRLRSIQFTQGHIDFKVQNISRKDLPADTAIQEIALFNYQGDMIRRAELKTSYFQGAPMRVPDPSTGSLLDSMYQFRLRLDSVLFRDTGTVNVETYRFEYNDVPANRVSFDQDRWGYYNAKGNKHLVEPLIIPFGSTTVSLEGGDRSVNPLANQMGMLTHLHYPTGGDTYFEYETNRYSSTIDSNGLWDFVPVNIYLTKQDPPDVMEGRPYSYTEYAFVVDGGSSIGGDVPVYAWGEIIQLNENAEYCPPQNITAELRIIGTDSLTDGINHVLLGSSDLILLPPGHYKLTLTFWHCDAYYFDIASGILHYSDYVLIDSNAAGGYQDHLTGGLRVKSITSYDGVSDKPLRKTYDYSVEGVPGFSSAPPPIQGYVPYYDVYLFNDNPNSANLFGSAMKRQSYSCIPQSTTHGSSVGYGRVLENLWEGDSLRGYTVNTFTTWSDFPDLMNSDNNFPFLPGTNRDYMRGLPVTKAEFGIKNGQSYLIHSLENYYKNIIDTSLSSVSLAFNGAMNSVGHIFEGTSPSNYLIVNFPFMGKYSEHADLALIDRSIEKFVSQDSPGSFLTKITSYNYSDDNYQPLKVTSFSEADSTIKRSINTKFPLEYFRTTSASIDSSTRGLQELIDRNMIGLPVETSFEINRNGSSKVGQAQITRYEPVSARLYGIDRLETKEPISITSLSDNSSGYFTEDGHVKPALRIIKHDSDGNTLTQLMANNVPESYVWDYRNSLPIAKCINADSSAIAATSFEADGTGGWQFSGTVTEDSTSPTGRKCYILNGHDIVRRGFKSQGYIVSYWAKGGQASVNGGNPSKIGKTILGWTYYEHVINSDSAHISGTYNIDEVRIFPIGSQMITFTYQPLVGVTSQCDANNKITYFFYDSFMRLSLVRDQDRKIVRQISYRYNCQPEQIETIAYQSAAIAADYYSQNCSSGQTPEAYSVSVPAGMFTSYISQTAADSMANAYAQQQANLHGTCATSNINVVCTSDVGSAFTIQLHNNTTGVDYYVSLSGHSEMDKSVPPGNYDITMIPGSPFGYFNYDVGCGYSDAGSVVYFYSVDLSSSCNTIYIY